LALCKVGDIIRNEMQGYGTPPVIRRADLSHPSQLRCPPLEEGRVHRGQRRDGRAMNELKGGLDQMRNVSQWDQCEETHQKD
ncbi:MAG: hypothetical protein EZS28_036220, partial [Streblomastix strix]